ncbi:uncharacterized protein LOC124662947 [Lolium rigidum]|uniref:uncharacterized protein LOC124662947 n=1 Tax=Lolium rigidum TaxID=89674 RepID=UPI001F5CDFB7|nr:uncharacterized protein LOC124662947 [Lolium rigidum]
MPPLRRRLDRARSAPTPYPNGWLSRRPRRSKTRRADGDEVLPADVLTEIIARASSGAADVARFSSTCRRWGFAVATHAAAICRSLPPPTRYQTHLTLGFFHQENEDVRAFHRRRRPCDSAQPTFVPTASASHLLGTLSLGSHLLGGLFEHARPVASRNGRLVLELRRKERAQGLTLSVYNPMTGEVSVLPALSGEDCPGYYACAILTGDDLDASIPLGFFRVLLVYNRRSFTAMRIFSSDVGSWRLEGRMPGAKMDAGKLRRLGPAVVVRGVAYWPMHRAALGVRLDGALMDVCFVPYNNHYFPDYRLLGVTPDGNLSFVFALFIRRLIITIESLKPSSASEWEFHELIKLPEVPTRPSTALKLRWFNEKSGTVLFTIREGGEATSGAFMLNLATRSLEKLAGGVECHGWRNFCGYEMDRAAHLASVAHC